MPNDDMIVDLAPPKAGADRTQNSARPNGREAISQRSAQDDDEDYGARVRRRIGKLTARNTELDQRASYWERKANQEAQRAAAAEHRLTEATNSGMEFYAQTVSQDVANAEAALEAAHGEGDPKKIAEATRQLSRATAREREIERMKATAPAEAPAATGDQGQRQIPQQQQAPSYKPVTAQWMTENAKWFGKDPQLTQAANGFDAVIRAQGLNPGESEDAEREYFEKLDGMLHNAFPDEFEAPGAGQDGLGDDGELEPEEQPMRAVERGQKRDRDRQPVSRPAAVAPASRRTSPDSPASGKVRLSADQVDIARSMGITPVQYAASLQALRKSGTL